ncbi:MAG TPA: hypothetical protein DHU79_03420 [Clostridiales bacterium]|nr:hypothetical protein [Clostridiales bacterium]
MAKAKKQEKSIEQRLEETLVLYEKTPYELPSSWCWTKLPYITQIKTGKRDANHAKEDGQYRFYTCSAEYSMADTYAFEGESIIVPGNGDIGLVFYYDGKFEAYQRTYVINGFKGQTKYLYYYFYYKWREKNTYKQFGTAIPYVRMANFEEFEIPLAPLEEQKRIVEIIEKQFAKLDEARDLIQKSLDSFADRKSAILHKAVTGELTEKWRVENRVSDEWKTVPFKEFCYLNRGFDLPIQNRVKGKVPLVASNGIIDYVDRANVIGPGVVTGRSGTIGKVFYIKEDYWPLNTALYSKDCCGNNAKYIYYYLSSFNFKQYSSSTAVPTLNRNNFFNVEVKVPSIKEQEEIVRILDSIFEKEDKSKELLDMLDKIDEMKKSILARAFRGQLGTFNPTDEPATDLLRKILEQSN